MTRETPTATATDMPPCWSCGADVAPGAPFCAACAAVQPPGQADHFARLGLRRGFALDEAELRRRYFERQRQLHPDRFANAPERARAFSMQQSTTLNDAFETLRSPLRRAEYLLSLAGVTVNAETGNLPTDPETLAEAMAMREALAEAADAAAVTALAADVGERSACCLEALAAAFAADDVDRAARLATRLKYLERLDLDLRRRRTGERAGP